MYLNLLSRVYSRLYVILNKISLNKNYKNNFAPKLAEIINLLNFMPKYKSL